LVWGFVSQSIARSEFEASLAAEGLAYNEITVIPTPFNTILWTATAKSDDGYYVGSYSLFDEREKVAFSYVPAQLELLNGYQDNERVKRMLHFANGYAIARQEDPETIKVYSIKFGPMNAEEEPRYFFPMVIQSQAGSEPLIYVDESRAGMEPEKALPLLFERLKGI
jgi:inner membrane protein